MTLRTSSGQRTLLFSDFDAQQFDEKIKAMNHPYCPFHLLHVASPSFARTADQSDIP